MARPEKFRMIKSPPVFYSFKPAGIPMSEIGNLNLSIAEYEAIRLADFEGLDHADAAKEMEVSRPTFTRLIEKARNKVATFLVEGHALSIEGGNIHFNENLLKCLDCGHIFRIQIGTEAGNCQRCHSENVSDLALKYGHGQCCRNRHRGGRRGKR